MEILQIPEIFRNQHNCVWGQTQSGKTYWTVEHLKRSALPCFFFNTQYEEYCHGFIQMDKTDDIEDVLRNLKRGEKIDYRPSTVRKFAQGELDRIIDAIFYYQPFTKERPFLFVIDECHIYAEQGLKSRHVQRIATGGMKFGFRAVFISQSPAAVDKLLLKQSSRHIFFKLDKNYEGKYMKEKGYDFDAIDVLNGDKEKHIGVLCDFGEIKGIVKA